MIETDQSTPQPWHAEDPDESGHVVIADSQDVSVCRCYQQPYDTWTAAANAAYIVKAVNIHEDVLLALKKSEQRITQLCGIVNALSNRLGLGDKVRAEHFNDLARTVLTKATRTTPQRASDRPGDQAAVMHEETGIDYETCLVMCNMD